MFMSANDGSGQHFTSEKSKQGIVSMVCHLRKGQNTIRLYNDSGTMPDVDYMEVKPISR